MRRHGFTVVELIIVITIMGILLILGIVNLRGSQANARDDERKSDIEAISLHLDTYYNVGLPVGTSVPTITNLIPNPSFETSISPWNLAGSGATVVRSSEQVFSGNYSAKVIPSSTNTYTGIYISAPGQDGTQYTYSAYVYSTSSQQLNFAADGYLVNTAPTIGPSWQKISVTGIRANSNPLYVRAINATGIPFFVDGVTVVQGPTTFDYSDGNTSGWYWSGTTNNSTSTGPVILPSTPGSYPSISITSPPLLTVYLQDADIKSFSAPSKTDPYTTFIPATNAVQTATGVTPQPTIDQYVYQPINTYGSLCYNNDCRKYNIYYRSELDNNVYKVTSKNQ